MSEVYIDDVDAAVTYSGRWRSATEQMRSYQGTMHYTNYINSRATLTFTGINVIVYGSIRAEETPQSSYSLDGGDPTVYNSSTTHLLTQDGVIFYTSPILRNGQHTLAITNLNEASTFFLDYFVIVTNGATASTSSSQAGITSTTSPSTSSTRPGTSSSSGPVSSSSISRTTTLVTLRGTGSSGSSAFDNVPLTSTAPPSGNMGAKEATHNTSGTHHTAAIIGAVAALAIVAFFIIVCLLLRRRRKQQEESDSRLISSFSGGAAVPTTSLPAATPQMNEERPPFPPDYALSEPPAYDLDVGPVDQAGDSHILGNSVGLRRSEKRSMITTQLESGGVVYNGSSTVVEDRNI